MRKLDDIVIRAAMIDARRFHCRGMSPANAARFACLGSWQIYCTEVERRLLAELAEKEGEQRVAEPGKVPVHTLVSEKAD